MHNELCSQVLLMKVFEGFRLPSSNNVVSHHLHSFLVPLFLCLSLCVSLMICLICCNCQQMPVGKLEFAFLALGSFGWSRTYSSSQISSIAWRCWHWLNVNDILLTLTSHFLYPFLFATLTLFGSATAAIAEVKSGLWLCLKFTFSCH